MDIYAISKVIGENRLFIIYTIVTKLENIEFEDP